MTNISLINWTPTPSTDRLIINQHNIHRLDVSHSGTVVRCGPKHIHKEEEEEFKKKRSNTNTNRKKNEKEEYE